MRQSQSQKFTAVNQDSRELNITRQGRTSDDPRSVKPGDGNEKFWVLQAHGPHAAVFAGILCRDRRDRRGQRGHGPHKHAASGCVCGGQLVTRRAGRPRAPLASAPVAPPPALLPWDDGRLPDADEMVAILCSWDKLRRSIWDCVGFNWNLTPITPNDPNYAQQLP